MIGRSLAHYRITAAIGAGGMGEVYRATAMKLGREVALKVRPAEMATSPGRVERFLQLDAPPRNVALQQHDANPHAQPRLGLRSAAGLAD